MRQGTKYPQLRGFEPRALYEKYNNANTTGHLQLPHQLNNTVHPQSHPQLNQGARQLSLPRERSPSPLPPAPPSVLGFPTAARTTPLGTPRMDQLQRHSNSVSGRSTPRAYTPQASPREQLRKVELMADGSASNAPAHEGKIEASQRQLERTIKLSRILGGFGEKM